MSAWLLTTWQKQSAHACHPVCGWFLSWCTRLSCSHSWFALLTDEQVSEMLADSAVWIFQLAPSNYETSCWVDINEHASCIAKWKILSNLYYGLWSLLREWFIYHHTQIMIWTFLYFLLWVLMAVGLSLIMALYLELQWACSQFQPDVESAMMTSEECFTLDLDGCEYCMPNETGWLGEL